MNDEEPLVTILVPTYKRTELLKRAIESVLEQSYKNIQLVILDNNSPDETVQVIKSYISMDSRIVYVKNSMNIGILANFRKTFDFINGDYFRLLCSDDVIPKDAIKKQVKFLKTNPDIPLVFGKTEIINSNTGQLYSSSLAFHPKHSIVPVQSGIDNYLKIRRSWSISLDDILFRTDYIIYNNINLRTNYLNADNYFQAEMLLYTENIGFINESTIIRDDSSEHYYVSYSSEYSHITALMQIYDFIVKFDHMLISKDLSPDKYKYKLFLEFCVCAIRTHNSTYRILCERMASNLLSELLRRKVLTFILYPLKIFYRTFYPLFRNHILKIYDNFHKFQP